MTSRVFPSAPAGPLVVAAGGHSDLQGFGELAGMVGGDLTMFVRLVKLGSGCAPPGGPDPEVRLSAGGGPAVQVAMYPDASPVHDGQGNYVADAMCDAQSDGVYRVRVFIARPASAWQLQIVNQDAEPRGFTWVVADNDQEARQPWIELPSTVGIEALAGQQVTSTVRVANLGTGRLTIADAVGFRPGPGFELVGVPGPVSPNGCGELQVRFTAPSTPGTSTAVYTATSDDPTAGHNRRIALTATTKAPDSVLHPGDIIISAVVMDFLVGGVVRVDPATGGQTLLFEGDSFMQLIGVAVEADGKLLIANFRGPFLAGPGSWGRVIRVDPATGADTVAASGGAFIHPMDVAVEADGSFLVADNQAVGGVGAIIRVAPATGAQSVVSSGGRPTALAVQADGKILFTAEAGFDGAAVIRVDPSSGATTQLSSLGSFRAPVGVAVEADGHILVADAKAFSDPGGGVIRVDPVSGAQTTVSSGGNFVRPDGIAVEAGGTILVADPAAFDGTGGVIRVDPVSGAQTVLSSGGVFKSPFGIAVVPTAGGSGGG